MKVKTSTLEGVALDWAVAKCEGFCYFINLGKYHRSTKAGSIYAGDYYPSSNRSLGGPIIEREKIDLDYGYVDGILAWDSRAWSSKAKASGNSPLIAAMRCYVMSKLGDTINIPEELL